MVEGYVLMMIGSGIYVVDMWLDVVVICVLGVMLLLLVVDELLVFDV